MNNKVYKYGIDITNATLQTYAYELGIEKAVSEMSQMEKQQLRVLTILDQSEVAFGDLANTINSPSNMIRQMTNNFKEASIILGQLFMPVVENVLPMINGLSIAIKDLLTDIAGFLGIKIDMDAYGQGFSGTEEDIDGITEGLDEATESANELKKSLRGFDKLNLISTANSGGNGLGGAIDLTQQIVDATQEYEKRWQEAFDKMENRADEFAKYISKALEPVKKIIQDFAIGDYFQAGQDVSNFVVSINEFLADAIENVDWEKVGKDIGDFLAGIEWEKVLDSIGDVFWKAINGVFETWKTSFDTAPIETAIITALAGAKFLGVDSKIAGAISKSIAGAGGLQIALIAGSLVWGALEGEEEGELRDKIAQYQSQGMSHEDARNLAAKESGSGYFDKVALYQYDVKHAETQATLGIVEIFNKIGDNIWNAFKGGWNPVTGYATGGFPEDGWFRASKGEYFGSFDDGTSVIANNNQIISGIANGVRDANSDQNALLREQNALLRQILAKDTGISSRDVFNAVRTEDRNYSLRNGQSAFAY